MARIVALVDQEHLEPALARRAHLVKELVACVAVPRLRAEVHQHVREGGAGRRELRGVLIVELRRMHNKGMRLAAMKKGAAAQEEKEEEEEEG